MYSTMASGGHVVLSGMSAGPGCAQKSDEEKCQLRYSLLTGSKTIKGEISINRFKLCHIKKYPKSLDENLNKQNIQVSSFGKELYLVSRGNYRVYNVTAVPAVLKNLENSLVFRHYQLRDRSERLLRAIQEHEQLKALEVSFEEHTDTGVVVVCKKTDENHVFKTVEKIIVHIISEESMESASSTNRDDKSHLSKEGKAVTVKSTGVKMDSSHVGVLHDIPLTNEMLDFVQQHEPQQFLLAEMGKIGIHCHVVQKDECLRLETDQKHGHLEMAEELFYDLIQMKQIPDSKLLNQLFELKEITEILKQNKKIAAKIKVYEKDKNFFILMTRDVINQVDHCLQMQLRVEAKFFHFAADIISKLTAEDEKELDEICGNITDGRVIYKIVHEGTSGIYVCGMVDAFHIFREKLVRFLDGRNVHLKLEGFMQNLLHNHHCAKYYILDKAKRRKIKLLWDGSKRSLYLPDGQTDHKQQIQNMLPRWIVKKQIPFEQQWERRESTVEDVQKHLMSCQEVHQHKAFVMAESSGFILVGTDDVIENVFQLVESYIKSLRAARSVSAEGPGNTLESSPVDPDLQAPTKRKRRPEDPPCFHIKLTEMQERLLRENRFARESLVHHFQKQEFPLQFDLEKSIVTFEVRSSLDQTFIKDIWQKVFVIRCLDFEQETILIRPSQVKSKLKQQFDDLHDRVMFSFDEKSLHFIGIIEPAQPVVERLEVIIHDYKMYTMILRVKDVNKLRSYNSEIKKIEKMDEESLSRIEMKEGQVTLICPASRSNVITHTLFEFLDKTRSDKGSKDCVMSLPSYIDVTLKKNSKLKTIVEEQFHDKHWVIDISDEIVFSSFFYLDFEHQESELKAMLITKTFDLTGSLFTPDDIVSKLASMSGCEFETFYKSDNQLKLVCISDSGQKLDDAFQRISEEFESTTLDREKVKGDQVSSPDELTTQLWTIEPQLRNKAKMVILDGHLRLVYLVKMSFLALQTFDRLCFKLEMEDVNKENPRSKVNLTPLHVDLLKNPDAMRYVYQKVRSQHFQLHYDLDSKDLFVIALTTGDADCGRKLVESCFKCHTLNLKNHPILENLALTDVADMIQVQHTVHDSKIEIVVQEREKSVTFLCTDDVHEGVLKKVEQLLKQCSRSDHIVETPSMQVAEFINRFALKLQFSPKYPQVTAVLRKDGQTAIFELTGEKGEIPSAQAALSSLCDKVKLKEFSLEESEYNLLTSPPGQKLIAKVEDSSQCIISVDKSRSQDEMAQNQFGVESSTGVHIFDWYTSIVESDVVAVAFVNGDLSTEVETFLKRQSQFEEWKKLSTQLLRKQHENMKSKKVQPSVCFATSGKDDPQFAYVLLPGGETEADKETRNSSIGRLLQECVDLPARSVGLIVDVPDDTVKTVGKQIIHACLDNSHLKINIVCLREQKKVLRQLFKDAESNFGKFKRRMKLDISNKERKELFSSKVQLMVVAAGSETSCRGAFNDLKSKVFEMTKFPSVDEAHFTEDEDAMGYTHISTVPDFQGSQMPLLNCNAVLNPACQKIHDWKSVENKLKETYKMMILEKNGSYQVQCTSVTDFIAACNDLCKMWASKSSDKSSLVGRKRIGTSTTVSESMLRAVQHLIGHQQFDACCEVEDVSGSRKIFYLDNVNAKCVEQRIQDMIQEEEPARDAAKDRAKKVAEQALQDLMDVYIEYQPDKHVMLLFAEDWTVMVKAKKKVVSLFGQAKVSSRGARRFKQAGSSPVKPELMSYDNDSGCAKGTNIHVKVYKADILNLKVDVIVNAANGQLTHGGGVARIIASAAGNQMTRESHQYYSKFGEIKVSEVGVTRAGNLPYKMVFHAVGPYWPDYKNKQECFEDLCRTILRCLCEADQRGISTIALPTIGAAIFKVPKEKCAAMYVRALKSFDKYIKKTCLKEVHFVDISEEMVVRIREELKANWHVPSDSSELAKDSAFIQQCLWSEPAHSVGIEPIVKSASKSLQLDEEPYAGAQAQSGPEEAHKTKYEFSEHVSITVIKEDIFKMEANALVSWEELGSMTLRPFQKQLVSEGGKRYEGVRKKKLAQAKKGDIVPTTSGNLIQSQVIHAYVGMETNLKEFVTLLTTLFQQCLKWNYTSVLLPVFQKFSSTVKDKKPVNMFTETVVDALRKLSEDKTKPDLRVIIVNEQEETVQDLSSALSQCLISLGLTQNSDMNNQGEKECPICFEKMPDLKQLPCGHGFCKRCLKKAFNIKKACPVCGILYGPIFGTMPQGTMSTRTEWTSLPGFPGCKTIAITYLIPDGIQTEEHPNPGKRFFGAYWTAYLPDSYEGRKVLALLKVAWERRLTFTVGRSLFRGGDEDRVIWNEIHHKTKTSGGISAFGYPDDTYLEMVQEELKQKGITEKDLDTPIY